MTKHAKAAAFVNRMLDFLDAFPEDVRSTGPCSAYTAAAATIEMKYGLMQHVRDPDELRLYRQDIQRAHRRAAKTRSACVSKLRRYGERLATNASKLPTVPNLEL